MTRLPFKWHAGVVDSLVDFETVQPHERNPNNGDEDLVRESILTNGVYRHIYANRKTKRIVAGHTQYHVEVQLQLDAGVQRPVVPISWTDGDAKAALKQLTADNGTAAHARMDDALLLDLLEDFESLVGSGYTDFDIEALRRLADNTALAEGDLASDVSAGAFDLQDGQTLITVVIEEEHREAFYALVSELAYVVDVRDSQ